MRKILATVLLVLVSVALTLGAGDTDPIDDNRACVRMAA
jgi:hypothetical protein